MERDIGARAHVAVVVEFDLPSSWGSDCTCEQILDQASEEAVNHLRRIFKDQAIMIGKPKIYIVVKDEKQSP